MLAFATFNCATERKRKSQSTTYVNFQIDYLLTTMMSQDMYSLTRCSHNADPDVCMKHATFQGRRPLLKSGTAMECLRRFASMECMSGRSTLLGAPTL